MKSDLDLYTARDLRTRSSELIRDAERGKLSIITKRGRPTALTLSFDRRLVELGLAIDLALSLFERRLVTMAKAAKIAGLPLGPGDSHQCPQYAIQWRRSKRHPRRIIGNPLRLGTTRVEPSFNGDTGDCPPITIATIMAPTVSMRFDQAY